MCPDSHVHAVICQAVPVFQRAGSFIGPGGRGLSCLLTLLARVYYDFYNDHVCQGIARLFLLAGKVLAQAGMDAGIIYAS